MWVFWFPNAHKFSSVTQSCPTLCNPMDCSTPGFPVRSWWCHPSIHLILCHPLLLPPSIFPSIRVFSNESVLRIRWLKYWSFSISPSNEYSGLISFRMDWLDLLGVQGTLKSLLPKPQFKSISFLHSPPLTSIHDYWKNHSFDYMDFCWQSNVSAF